MNIEFDDEENKKNLIDVRKLINYDFMLAYKSANLNFSLFFSNDIT